MGQLEGETPAAEKLKELLTAATTENAQPARGAQGLIGKQAPSSNLQRRGQLAAALATQARPPAALKRERDEKRARLLRALELLDREDAVQT